MEQFVLEFLSESDDLVEKLAADVGELRVRREDGRMRRELVSRIFRHVHSLKGSSAAVELSSVTSLSHEFESLIDGVLRGRVILDELALDTFDVTTDVISQLLHAVADGREPAVPVALVERLRKLARTNDGESLGSGSASRNDFILPDDLTGVLSDHEVHRLDEAKSEGSSVFIVEARFDVATFDTEFKELGEALRASGEIVSTQPGMPGDGGDKICFRIVYAAETEISQLKAKLAHIGAVEVKALDAARSSATETVSDLARQTIPDEIAAQTESANFAATVRIDRSELDSLIEMTHKLFVETMETLEIAIQAKSPTTELETCVAEIRRHFEEIEKRLLKLHMVPIGTALERAIRAGTMAARDAGKAIDFESVGAETQLDKSITDVIAEPLLHLLRNAVDHGIESPDERASVGKNARGRITIDASIEGDHVRIKVTDDGRGIDRARVERAALDCGAISGQSKISVEESLRLIFMPGLTTAARVSEISGRGIGLDIVERAVAKTGGKVFVRSKLGVGTTFELLIPNIGRQTPPLARGSGGLGK
jgi:two-component system, chemotaxis family, sensor kinase CheA